MSTHYDPFATAPPPDPRKFAIRNLSVLCYAAGFTFWHYKAGSATFADVLTPGFFDDAKDGMLCKGDMILVSASDSGAQLYVDSVAPTVVVRVMGRTAE